jgi:hypothetical protein
MRGGVFDKPVPIQSEIYLDGQQNNPCITLTTSKNRFGSNFTIEIVVNTTLFKGDVRELLEKIFTSGGGNINYDSKNPKLHPRLRFLYGLADSPERVGAIKWTEADTLKKQGHLNDADKIKIAQAINTSDNKCFIKIETEKLKSGNLKFIVKRYSRIYPKEEGNAKIFVKRECAHEEHSDGGCDRYNYIYDDVPLYVPILKYDEDATPTLGITFIHWEEGSKYSKGVYKRFTNNENTFTIDTTDIETFIQNLNKTKILKTDGTLVDAPAPTSPSSDTSSTVDVAAAPVDV